MHPAAYTPVSRSHARSDTDEQADDPEQRRAVDDPRPVTEVRCAVGHAQHAPKSRVATSGLAAALGSAGCQADSTRSVVARAPGAVMWSTAEPLPYLAR